MRSLLIAGIFVHAEVSCLHARRAGPAARAYPLSYLLGPSLSLSSAVAVAEAVAGHPCSNAIINARHVSCFAPT
uniref:Putative secreted protein n=1 Tax=Anopheles triannulatus TaxID=58253 RepID=A0A2M4B649_9DIPT